MYPNSDTFEQLYPARDTLQHVIKAWWKMAWQKAGKHCQVLPVFFFVNEHNNTNMKPQAKKQQFLISEWKQQLVEKNDADIIRKVLCKSFIQRFRELNLRSYISIKSTVLIRSGYSFVAVEVKV